MSGLVYTGRWHLVRDVPPSAIVPVRISVGAARFVPGARRFPAIEELIPRGLLDVEDAREFTRRYRQRLEEQGVARIQARFDELHREFACRPLVLLCFEADRGKCHRGDFAGWWEDKTGVLVPERGAPALREKRHCCSWQRAPKAESFASGPGRRGAALRHSTQPPPGAVLRCQRGQAQVRRVRLTCSSRSTPGTTRSR
jgi:hypothetical protein